MADVIRVGNAQGFWGDSVDAAGRLVEQAPELDYLTLDYLAEVSLSIMAIQRDRDPSAGYARDFIDVVKQLAPAWKSGRRLKVITNAGGLAPDRCAQACAAVLREAGLSGMRIGVVAGDDCLAEVKAAKGSGRCANLETGEPVAAVADRLITANAYIGAAPVVRALEQGADLVLTGRVADPSMAVAPAAFEFGWSETDWDRLAGATIAGHLIECGTQVTGGISTDWLDVENPSEIGFPLVEIAPDGSVVVTKPKGTGGRVDQWTVKEQLLYEIGDPGNYLSPDVTVSFLSLSVEELGGDRVLVRGAKGRPATDQFKVSATFREGYRSAGLLTIFGRDAAKKARRSGQVLIDRVRRAGFDLEETLIETLGTGASVGGIVGGERAAEALEVVLRVSVKDRRKEAIERFTKELAPLVTSGAQGTTGYAAGRPSVTPVFGYWPCLIEKSRVKPTVSLVTV